MHDIFIVRNADGRNLCVFSSREAAEAERQYLDEIDECPLGESYIEPQELNLSFSGELRS